MMCYGIPYYRLPAEVVDKEIKQALQEGVEILYSWGPEKISGNDGRVAGIELVRSAIWKSVWPEKNGRKSWEISRRLNSDARGQKTDSKTRN